MARENGPLKISMQFFAEPADGGTGAGNAGSNGAAKNGSQNGSTSAEGATPKSTPQSTQNGATGQNNGSTGTPSLDQLIQSAVDRATNKLGNENKRLQAQLDELIKQKMTDEERIEMERKQERDQFEQEKAQFLQEKNRLFAVGALAKAELGVGSDQLEPLVSLVMGANEQEISQNIKVLSDLVTALVAAKVEQTFKDNGRNPAGSGNPDKNDGDKKTEVAERLGKSRAEKEKRSREILDKFTRRN